jgi:thioredoxin 1
MSGPTVALTRQNFEGEVLKSNQPVVIDFWAPWCGPCRLIGPVLEELATKHAGSVKVAKVNVDEQPELANAYQVRGIPTLMVVHKGKAINQMVGFRGRAPLESLFQDLAKLGGSAESN